jgi:hypothetical protein
MTMVSKVTGVYCICQLMRTAVNNMPIFPNVATNFWGTQADDGDVPARSEGLLSFSPRLYRVTDD